MVFPSHRKAVGIQWDQLVEITNQSGGITRLVTDAFEKEVVRVMSLPAEQQAEAIGKISGNVLGMIGVAGAGAKAAKVGGELLAKSAAARASANAAKVAARTAKESALRTEEAARLASQF